MPLAGNDPFSCWANRITQISLGPASDPLPVIPETIGNQTHLQAQHESDRMTQSTAHTGLDLPPYPPVSVIRQMIDFMADYELLDTHGEVISYIGQSVSPAMQSQIWGKAPLSSDK